MKIYLNDEKVDFILENEKTILEVVENLEAWVSSQKLYLTNCQIDDKAFYLLDPSQQQLHPSNFKVLKGNVYSLARYMFECLSEMQSYLNRLKRCLEEKNIPRELENLKGGIAWLKYNLGKIIDFFNLKESVLLESLKEFEITLFQQKPGSKLEDGLYDELDKKLALIRKNTERLQLKMYIETLMAKYQPFEKAHSEEALQDMQSLLESMRGVLPTIGENLQIGKDYIAMPYIEDMAGALAVLIYLLDALKKKNALDDKTIEKGNENLARQMSVLQARLNEVESALKDGHHVELSDLLEYELDGDLEKITDFVHILKEKLVSPQAVSQSSAGV